MAGLVNQEAIVSERAMLVRFCARYTGDADAAEDLAQQTLLVAWQHERQLRDPKARKSWLFSIARNACLIWARGRGREQARHVELRVTDGTEPAESLPDDVDLEMELEREELAALLDRAMALLPAETRQALIQRYFEDLPQAEVAAYLGLTEGAVEARLHRGKLALRRVLTTELSEEALSYGLILPEEAGQEETRIWCPGCGRRRLEGRLNSEGGELYMRCPDCLLPYDHYINSQMGQGLRGLRSYKPAVSRVLECIHDMYRVQTMNGVFVCRGCRTRVPLQRSEQFGIYLMCPACDWCDTETWHSLTWSLPEVRRFWREHPRMRFLPEREIELDGRPAVLTGFESVTGRARVEIVSLRDSLKVVSVDGAPAES